MRIKSTVRYELKYLITWQQRDAMLADLLSHMSPDSHGDGAGQYAITSLYYDSPRYGAYWEKLEGEKLRRKVRVRTYGEQSVLPDTSCFLEIKERHNKTLTKRRVRLPYQAAATFSNLNKFSQQFAKADDVAKQAVVDEVEYLYRTRHLQPTCVVRYNRLALNGSENYHDLRVTFDTELRARTHDLTLLSTGHAEDSYFLPPGMCVMEFKANRSVPYWLAQIAHKHRCTMRRISKYCLALEKCSALNERQQIWT